jgi:hypothetical protein
MVKDKHEDKHEEPKKPPPALAEGHSVKTVKSTAEKQGIHDDLLPVDSVPGTQYLLAINDDGTAGTLKPVSAGFPVGRPVLRVWHTDQLGQDKLVSLSGAPLGANLQPTPDFRFVEPDPEAIAKSNEKYADNRRAHDHENAHREHAHREHAHK